MSLKQVECFEDGLHSMFGSHYEFFKENEGFKNTLLIMSGLLTDILLLVQLARFSRYGGTWRFMVAITLLYFLRSINTLFFKMKAPEGGDLWDHPGFPSLVVSYGSQNDYYFNPVVAVMVLLFMEFKYQQLYKLMWTALFCGLFNWYMCTALRGHYFIDNVGGVMHGCYVWFMAHNWLSYYIDVKLFGMTVHERYLSIQTICGNSKCKAPINQWVQ